MCVFVLAALLPYGCALRVINFFRTRCLMRCNAQGYYVTLKGIHGTIYLKHCCLPKVRLYDIGMLLDERSSVAKVKTERARI